MDQVIFELPADTNRVENGPFEISTHPLSSESQFDEHLQHTYVAYAAHQNDENISREDLDDNSLEQPLPPISL